MLEMPSAMPLGFYLGQSGSQAVLDELNASWRNSGTGVIFEQDSFGDKFKAFSSFVTSQTQAISDTVKKAVEAVSCPNKIQEIVCEEDLRNIPACMYVPILTMPEIRPLFEGGQINGFGLDISDLPDEDVYGRLINNGKIDTGDPNYDRESPMSWEWKSTDPLLTIEELEKIETSRAYISTFLEEQLGPEGERRDPTDLSGTIGKLKKVKKSED